MFSYCNNNPIILVDGEGSRPIVGDDPNKETPEERHASFAAMKQNKKSVDLTEKLTQYMNNNAETLSTYLKENGYISACFYFYNIVRDFGELDIKLQDEWKFEANTDYYFNGTLLRYDDPGNINYGYIGAILFDLEVLWVGAGINQVGKYGFKYGDFSTYFDDPRDREMIERGYILYAEGTW